MDNPKRSLTFAGLQSDRWFWLACLAVCLLRLVYCAQLPANSSDLVRQLVYGELVWREGLSIAALAQDRLPYAIPVQVWPHLPYNYPVLPLAFFTLLAGAWPTLFCGKLALTAVEALNAWIVWRATGRRWMALVYWAAPISIWWVSHEGQFEPLQNLPALAAIGLLRRGKPVWALAALALAIQTKLLAGVLLPWMLIEIARSDGRRLAASLGAFALGFLPTALAALANPAFANPFAYPAPLHFNPYYFNPFDERIFLWNPGWLIAVNALASDGALLGMLGALFYSRDRWGYVPACVFVYFVKIAAQVQFWYWIVWPALILPIQDGKTRRWLWILYPLLDVSALVQMFHPAFGHYLAPAYFAPWTPFTPLHPLPPP
jgi:hypothetical protein